MVKAAKFSEADIEQWATQILFHAHAIEACSECGFKKLNSDRSALAYAHSLATHRKPRGLSAIACIEAVDAVFDRLSDECPACD